jgi:hypothetical protein
VQSWPITVAHSLMSALIVLLHPLVVRLLRR